MNLKGPLFRNVDKLEKVIKRSEKLFTLEIWVNLTCSFSGMIGAQTQASYHSWKLSYCPFLTRPRRTNAIEFAWKTFARTSKKIQNKTQWWYRKWTLSTGYFVTQKMSVLPHILLAVCSTYGYKHTVSRSVERLLEGAKTLET